MEESYFPGVSVFRGKVINLDEDDHSPEKTAGPIQKDPVFHQVFKIHLLSTTESFHFTQLEKFPPLLPMKFGYPTQD